LPSAPSPKSSESTTEARSPDRSPWLRWVPVVVWAGFISWFSGDAFSARSTHNYIDPILRLLFGDLTPEGFRYWHAVVRKSAHFIEYCVLALLLVRALATPSKPVPATTGLLAVGMCGLFASADELHQFFVPSRGGSALDVALDTFGAVIGTLLFVAFRRLTTRPGAQPAQ